MTARASDPTRHRTAIGAIATLLTAGGFAIAAGPAGLAVSVLVGAVWYLRSVPFAIATGFVSLVPLVPPDAPLSTVAPAAIGLLLFAFSETSRDEAPVGSAIAVTIGTLAFAGVAGLVYRRTGETWLAGLSVSVVVALLAYGLHRYELLRLGLVEDAR